MLRQKYLKGKHERHYYVKKNQHHSHLQVQMSLNMTHDTNIDTPTAYKVISLISSKPWAASNYLRDPSKKPNWLGIPIWKKLTVTWIARNWFYGYGNPWTLSYWKGRARSSTGSPLYYRPDIRTCIPLLDSRWRRITIGEMIYPQQIALWNPFWLNTEGKIKWIDDFCKWFLLG